MQYAACSQKRQEQFHGLGVPRTTTPPPEVCCCNLICLDQPKSLEKDKERKSFNAAGRDSATVSVTIYFTSEPRLVLLTSTQNKLQVHKLSEQKKKAEMIWIMSGNPCSDSFFTNEGLSGSCGALLTAQTTGYQY